MSLTLAGLISVVIRFVFLLFGAGLQFQATIRPRSARSCS